MARRSARVVLVALVLLGAQAQGSLEAQAPAAPSCGVAQNNQCLVCPPKDAAGNQPASQQLALLNPEFTVPLDDTGIRDWSFTNPRRPFPIVQTVDRADQNKLDDACIRSQLANAKVFFENQTSSRVFNVKFPFTLVSKPKGEPQALAWTDVKDRCQKVRMALALRTPLGTGDSASREQDSATKPVEKTKKKGELEVRRDDLKVLVRQEELDLEVRLKSEPGATPSRHLLGLRAELAKTLEDLAAMETPATPSADDITKLLALETLNQTLAQWGITDLEKARSSCTKLQELPLGDCSGPSPDASRDCLARAQELDPDSIKTVLPEILKALLFERTEQGAQESKQVCQDSKDGKQACDYTFTVQPGGTVMVSGAILAALDSGRVTFKVEFANETDPPIHDRGFLATSRKPGERPDSLEWSVAAALGGSTSPETSRLVRTPDDQKVFTSARFDVDHPYSGDHLERWTGAGSLTIKKSAGDRVDASATMTFKDGNLGENSSGNVSVSKYLVTAYGDNGLQLRFGKYPLFTSRETISGSLKGESFELIFRSLSLGVLVKKNRTEKPDKVGSQVIDYPERAVTFSLQNLPFAHNPVLRTWSVSGVYGDEHGNILADPLIDPVSGNAIDGILRGPFRYATLGTDLTFGMPVPGKNSSPSFTGAFSLYTNRRWKLKGGSDSLAERIRKATGTVGLVSLRLSPAPAKSGEAPSFTIEGKLGYGTGDDPKTNDRDEGYLGEGAGFAPDSLFLSSFAGRIGPLDERKRPEIERGLSNKQYFGLTYTDTRSSLLLEALAHLLGIREQVISQSTSASLHHYRFNQPVFGERDAGTELNIRFEIQVPKGATTSLAFGKLLNGHVLDKVLAEEPWIATGQVKVSF